MLKYRQWLLDKLTSRYLKYQCINCFSVTNQQRLIHYVRYRFYLFNFSKLNYLFCIISLVKNIDTNLGSRKIHSGTGYFKLSSMKLYVA